MFKSAYVKINANPNSSWKGLNYKPGTLCECQDPLPVCEVAQSNPGWVKCGLLRTGQKTHYGPRIVQKPSKRKNIRGVLMVLPHWTTRQKWKIFQYLDFPTWSNVLPQAYSRLLRWNWSTFSSSSLNWIPDSCRKFFLISWTFSVKIECIDLYVLHAFYHLEGYLIPPRGTSSLCDLSFLHSDTTSRIALKWKSMRLSIAGSVARPPSWKRSHLSPSLCILMSI